MSQPADHPSRKPPRAEPLQPDRPARSTGKQEENPSAQDAESARKQKEQSEAALDNVREGYR